MIVDYKVELDSYNGPLDLLLYLIRKEEVDIYDIPISRVTEQYVAYLGDLQKVDIGLAGDFLVMASTLMYIKSQMLLPHATIDTSEDFGDPRLELVTQLLEYKRFKEATSKMAELSEEKGRRYSRPKDCIKRKEEEGVQLDLGEIDIWKLSQLFSNFMRQTLNDVSTTIVSTDIPVRVYMDTVMQKLSPARSLSFRDLFFDTRNKKDIIGFFLALLELVRLGKIKLEQFEDFDEIRVVSNTIVEEGS
ncbi:MAG: chromosome segregation protein ScpA [Candidatus Scalindua sp. AMX11]|nr:MAG: chromosome segregation protein ScpA [Candidatus Scalindua sp.]NOG83845.1 segregation/condensation protein A [Planctomycetota bacterium]RZV82997.1 MAG: chromosome segregation protein ScpA [Candidatus Scalindua sp. SCAELEC01]TDE64500.1 MAG: chromosome segregation protein ScpA [Candidatus Scalindua sp. AMX11]GJQ58759.1 MAG: segregation and condensation protein A [Candidatus Scalindua sp.]